MSNFPVIPFSRTKAVTSCSLLFIIVMAVVHGHWMDGRNRLWVASRMTVTRLRVGRVGGITTWQDRWLPVATRRWRARVQGVVVLIGRWGTGIGHGHSRAEGKPQLLGPALFRTVRSAWASGRWRGLGWAGLDWGSVPRPVSLRRQWGGAARHPETSRERWGPLQTSTTTQV